MEVPSVMLENTGIPTPEDIDSVFPSEERLNRGALLSLNATKKSHVIHVIPPAIAAAFDPLKI
jgi:hypothetical protein